MNEAARTSSDPGRFAPACGPLGQRMLSELVVGNLALLQRASLGFGPGLNVITGETGAGKSFLIGALELLLESPAP